MPKIGSVLAKSVGRLGRLATAMTPNTLAGKLTDGLAEFYELATTTTQKIKQSIIRSADGKIDNIYEEVQENGQTVARKICGSCLAQNTAVFGADATLETLQPLTTVQTLEKDGSIGQRNVWGKVGRMVSEYVKIFVGKDELKSSSDHEFKTSEGWKAAGYLRTGVLLFSLALNSFVAVDSVAAIHEPLQVEGLSLSEVQGYGVGSLGVVVAQSPRCLLRVSASEAAYSELQRLFPSNKLNEIMDIMDELPNTYTLEKLDDGPLRLIDNTTTPTKEWVEFADNSITCQGGEGITTQSSLRNQFLNKQLLPNRIYEVDGYKYTTDVQGRVSKIEGELRNGPNRRDPTEQTKAKDLKDGSPTDDGGHMIGARFNGPVEQINYFPQDITSNRYGTWKNMENEWADVLQGNKPEIGEPPVKVEITPVFGDASSPKRPTSFNVKYSYNNIDQPVKNILNP